MPAPTHPHSTATHTQHPAAITTQSESSIQSSTPVLRLRAPASDLSTRRRIQWADGVVDNEGLGRKRSKVCCIYHAPRPVGESSSESSSDSDSSSDDDHDGRGGSDDDDDDGGKARMSGDGNGKRGRGKNHEHAHSKRDKKCMHGNTGATARAEDTAARKSRNAYESAPKSASPEVKN